MDSAQMPEGQRPHKQITLPRGEFVAAIHGKSRRRDRRRPIDYRLLEPGTLRIRRHIGARIVHAVSDDWPPVIPARHDDVEFVAPARTVLRFVKPSALRIENQTLWVAMTPGVDLRSN